jgi:hypothetical protein
MTRPTHKVHEMSMKYLALVGAMAIAGPASAITINMSSFTLGDAADATMLGSSGSPSYDGAAGEFTGQFVSDSTPSLLRSSNAVGSPSSFNAWCAELTQNFYFGVNYSYSTATGAGYFGGQKSTDLSRLFTAAQGFVVDSATSAAMQAGIWEIIYETGPGYGFGSGNFRGSAGDASDQGAFNTIDSFLTHLGTYSADYQIEVLTNPSQQDFVIATIPEPETWALFALGLGALSYLKRRRKV